jgi:hypothetical protein
MGCGDMECEYSVHGSGQKEGGRKQRVSEGRKKKERVKEKKIAVKIAFNLFMCDVCVWVGVGVWVGGCVGG